MSEGVLSGNQPARSLWLWRLAALSSHCLLGCLHTVSVWCCNGITIRVGQEQSKGVPAVGIKTNSASSLGCHLPFLDVEVVQNSKKATRSRLLTRYGSTFWNQSMTSVGVGHEGGLKRRNVKFHTQFDSTPSPGLG